MRLVLISALLILGCSAPEFKSLPTTQDASPDATSVQDAAFPDAPFDATSDAGSSCNDVRAFAAKLMADTFLDGNDPNPGANNNHGDKAHLLVGARIAGKSEPYVTLMRFRIDGLPLHSQFLSMRLTVTTADPGAIPTGGGARVYFMRPDWTEGTGVHDGANWAQRIADCAACGSGPLAQGCCTYTAWDAPGATGPTDRAAQPAATVELPAAFDQEVNIPLAVSTLGTLAGDRIGVQIVGANDDKTYLWLASKDKSGAAALYGTYCADSL